jgi:hypothetical protein
MKICFRHKRPAVCLAWAAAGQEFGNTFLCEECGEDGWAGKIEPLFPVCEICHERPSVNFLASPEEQTLSPWRTLTTKETLSLWAKRHYFCQRCTHVKPFASPWTSDDGTSERFFDYLAALEMDAARWPEHWFSEPCMRWEEHELNGIL